MGTLNDPQHPLLGIDLGTTYSAIAWWNGRGPAHFVDRFSGNPVTPSVVHFDDQNGHYVVGDNALGMTLIEPHHGIIGVKRYMNDKNYQAVLGTQRPRGHTPVEVSSKILQHVYLNACLGPENLFRARGVVVTVPYYFMANQRRNTRDAADLAGLPNVLGIVDEPVAASLSYAWDVLSGNGCHDLQEKILVFDLGGGTFDVTAFDYQQTENRLRFEVLCTGGDHSLGGMDFDERLLSYVQEKEGVDLEGLSDREKANALQKLRDAVRKAKENLAALPTTRIIVPGVPCRQGSFINALVSRDELNDCISDYTGRIVHILLQTCMDGGVLPKQSIDRDEVTERIKRHGIAGCKEYFDGHTLDRVVRVGGSSKMLFFKKLLEEMFGADKVYSSPRIDLAVTEGAALFAAYSFDSTALEREVEIIHRTSHPFGVELAGGYFSPLIDKNEILPVQAKKCYRTNRDDVAEINVKVYQGVAETVAQNSHVGTVSIRGIPPRPAGRQDIWVTFDMDSQGLLMVNVDVVEAGQVVMATTEPLDTR